MSSLRLAVIAIALLDPVQDPVRIRVVDYPRPVAEAVRQVERVFGFTVTYEDTIYVHPDDVVDITARVRRDGDLSKKVLGMRNGSIEVTYPRTGTGRAQEVEAVLGDVLQASRAAGNAGDFRVACAADACHVIPVAIRGTSGVRELYTPLLDTPIQLEAGALRGAQFVERVIAATEQASGRRLLLGMMPTNLMLQRQVALDGRSGPARDVLRRGLRAISPRLSWQLLCGAGTGAACALNVHLVDLQ